MNLNGSRKVTVKGDVGINLELSLDDIAEPGSRGQLKDAELVILDSFRMMIRNRIRAILDHEANGDREA